MDRDTELFEKLPGQRVVQALAVTDAAARQQPVRACRAFRRAALADEQDASVPWDERRDAHAGIPTRRAGIGGRAVWPGSAMRGFAIHRPRMLSRRAGQEPHRRSGRRFEGGFIDQALGAGEAVRCRRRLHPILLVPGIVLILPAAFMIIWPSTILLGVTFAGLVIGAFAVLTLSTSEIAVTDRRVLAQIHGEALVIPIGHATGARATASWLGRRIGFGALRVELRLPRTDRLVIRGVMDPAPLAAAINDSFVRYAGENPDLDEADEVE